MKKISKVDKSRLLAGDLILFSSDKKALHWMKEHRKEFLELSKGFCGKTRG